MEDAFNKEDYADFRLNLVLRKVGQRILLDVLKYAIPKPEDKTYYEYFSEDGNMSFKIFDTCQKQKLKTDKNGTSFDISLLFKLYINGSPKVFPPNHLHWKTQGELEYFLGSIKKTRNDMVHATTPIKCEDLNGKIIELGTLFKQFLTSAQVRFGIPESLIERDLVKIEEDIQIFLTSPFNQTDVDEYLLSEGVSEAKIRYKNLSFINPVDFFIGLEFSTKIDEIFVSLEIKELENYEEGQRISVNSLFHSYVKNNTSLLLVEGLAGSGKTTLSKYILSQWVDNSSSIVKLNEFVFIIYLQCNNTYINSLYDLISSILPKTSRRFQKDELIESILRQNVLILVDGVDEAHSGTKSVLKELFHKSYGNNIKFFCTSRPEKIPWIYRIKGNLSCGTLSIVGVAKEDIKVFVKKLHSFYENTIEQQNLYPLDRVIKSLEKLSSTFLANDLKLPLFLALFTYLCTVEPRKIEGVNSVVALYNALILALKDRLLTRSLAKCEAASFDYDEDEIEIVINDCFDIFCEEALSGIFEDKETISKESLNKIRLHSTTIGLGMKDILSAFLVVKIVLTPLGIGEVVGFPHKGLKEYLAAKAIAKKVKTKVKLSTIFETKDVMLFPKQSTQLDLNTGLIKYQNLILYLAGILVMEGLLTENYVNEILRLYRKAGVYSVKQWLSILLALNFDVLACEFVLMKFKKLIIDDDYLETFLGLLKIGCPQEVVIKFDSSDYYHIQTLKKILFQLNKYDCNLNLMLRQFFKAPRTRNGSDLVNILSLKTSRCNLTWFQGSLEEYGIMCLPESIRVLSLGVGTKKQSKALSLIKKNSNILFLKIHVEKVIDPQDLPKLWEVFDFFLFLSGVQSNFSDVLWVAKVVDRLSANRKYGKILFPSSSLDSKTINKVLRELQKLKLTSIGGDRSEESKGGIYISTKSTISSSDVSEFKGFCNRIWGCKFAIMCNEEIWAENMK